MSGTVQGSGRTIGYRFRVGGQGAAGAAPACFGARSAACAAARTAAGDSGPVVSSTGPRSRVVVVGGRRPAPWVGPGRRWVHRVEGTGAGGPAVGIPEGDGGTGAAGTVPGSVPPMSSRNGG